MSNTVKTGLRPPMGEYAFQPLAGAFEPTIEDMLSLEPLMGMIPEGIYLWGTLRDDEGNIYDPMRRIPFNLPGAKVDTRRRFFLQTTLDSDHFKLHPCGRESAVNDGHKIAVEDGKVTWRSSRDVKGKPFLAEWTPDSCRWVEEGVMDIRGTLIKPGLQWYIASRTASMSYVACIMRMEGEILGRQVRGFIGFDKMYMYEGGECYVTKDALVQEKLELCWYTWANIYKDGTIDAGHFLIGNDMLGFGILTNEKGEVRFTYDVDCEVTFAPDGYWHTGIKATVFGEQYEFTPDPKGKMPELGPIPNPQVDGVWRRVGDKREPEIWFAWGEAAPTHGTKPVLRLPGVGERIIAPIDRFKRRG